MLRQRVATDGMMAHLAKLQQIANANDGKGLVTQVRQWSIGLGAWLTRVASDHSTFSVGTSQAVERYFAFPPAYDSSAGRRRRFTL